MRFLSALKVQGRFKPVLKIRWPDVTISHKFAPLTYSLIKAIPLKYMKAYHLRKILGSPHFVRFHVKESTASSQILPPEGTRWVLTQQEATLETHHPNRRPEHLICILL
jgi:hypothetical protein